MDKTISERICKLQTDPRFWTFDGKQHDIYSAGEFVLYRHKKRNVEVSRFAKSILWITFICIKLRFYKNFLQVHALFTACSGTGDSAELNAACTCGVAIRVEDSLYMYRTCGQVSYQTVSLLAHHSTIYEVCNDKHMVVSTESDGFTKVNTILLFYMCLWFHVVSWYDYLCSFCIDMFILLIIDRLLVCFTFHHYNLNYFTFVLSWTEVEHQ